MTKCCYVGATGGAMSGVNMQRQPGLDIHAQPDADEVANNEADRGYTQA
jgi:hypothetical protein